MPSSIQPDHSNYPHNLPPPLIVILGPTAVGKTEIAIQLAERIQGEIISVDSRLFYREMDIGTAKPSSAELHRVPHYLVDIAAPDQILSLAVFQSLARARHQQSLLPGIPAQRIKLRPSSTRNASSHYPSVFYWGDFFKNSTTASPAPNSYKSLCPPVGNSLNSFGSLAAANNFLPRRTGTTRSRAPCIINKGELTD